MLQINYIKQNVSKVKEGLALKNFTNLNVVDEIIAIDEEIRKQKAVTENLQASINTTSKEIGALMAKGNTDEANGTDGRSIPIGNAAAMTTIPHTGLITMMRLTRERIIA